MTDSFLPGYLSIILYEYVYIKILLLLMRAVEGGGKGGGNCYTAMNNTYYVSM